MNLEQISAGLAWHYKKYHKEQTPLDRALYSVSEIEAREAKWGLWHDPDPVPYGANIRTNRCAPQIIPDRTVVLV